MAFGCGRWNLSSFVENIVRLHLEEYGEDIEKWRKLWTHRKKVEGFPEKGRSLHSKPSTLFRERSNGHLLNILIDGSIPNVISQRMHGIHFSAAKRLVRKRFVSWYCKTSVCTHKLPLLPSSDYRGDKTVITPFSSVSIQDLRGNKSSTMINFQRSLYEQI